MFMAILSADIAVYHLHAVFVGSKKGTRIPRAGVTNRFELPWGHWELNTGFLEEQPVLLSSGPSCQIF